MTQDQIDDFFPDASIDTVVKLNLFINVEIATDEAVKMNSVTLLLHRSGHQRKVSSFNII